MAGTTLLRGVHVLFWTKKRKPNSSTQAEFLALLIAAQVAQANSSKSIAFFLDAQEVGQVTNRRAPQPCECEDILSTFLSVVHNFDLWTCQWVPRTVNTFAHDLAQWDGIHGSNVSSFLEGANSPSYDDL